MKIAVKIITSIGLLLIIFPSIGVFYEVLSQEENKNFMLIGTILGFGPKILFKEKKEDK
jgi:hypothetical protein